MLPAKGAVQDRVSFGGVKELEQFLFYGENGVDD